MSDDAFRLFQPKRCKAFEFSVRIICVTMQCGLDIGKEVLRVVFIEIYIPMVVCGASITGVFVTLKILLWRSWRMYISTQVLHNSKSAVFIAPSYALTKTSTVREILTLFSSETRTLPSIFFTARRRREWKIKISSNFQVWCWTFHLKDGYMTHGIWIRMRWKGPHDERNIHAGFHEWDGVFMGYKSVGEQFK